MSDKLLEQMELGNRAQTAMQELDSIFRELEAECFVTFKNSGVHDDEGRKTCRLYLKVLEDVKDKFQLAIINGNAAKKAKEATTQSS